MVDDEPRALSMAEIETKRQAGDALSIDDMLAIAQFDNEAMSGALEAREAELQIGAERVDQGKKPVANPSSVVDPDWTENNVIPGKHYYSHLSEPICKAGGEGCNLSDVVDVMNKKAAHPNQKRPFVPTQDYVADVDFPGPFGKDSIRTTALYNSDGVQHGLQNDTLMTIYFIPPPQNAASRISIKVPVEVKVSVRRTEGSGYPQYDQQLTGGIQKVEAVVGDKSYEAPIACLQNLRWPIQSIAIQQDESFTIVLARTHSITEPTQTFILRIAINYSDTALQAQKAVTCERREL